LEDRTGHRYFAHLSQFESGARMITGFRITFAAAKTERGPAALNIKPQN
jgi:cold shock CspA family protein